MGETGCTHSLRSPGSMGPPGDVQSKRAGDRVGVGHL